MSSQRMHSITSLLLLLPILLASIVAGQTLYCSEIDIGDINNSTTYKSNLDTVLSSMSRNINSSGFYNASAGRNSGRVNAVAVCRGDLAIDPCRECVRNASVELLGSCNSSMEAIMWRDECMVRYSNGMIFGVLESDPTYCGSDPDNATSPYLFKENLRRLMLDLRDEAASGNSQRKVAAGNITGPDFQTIFGLVQCSPDLSQGDCSYCILGAIGFIPMCSDGMRGGRLLRPSCNIRYEIFEFFNGTRFQELAPVVAAPPQVIFPKGNGNNTRTIVIIVVPIVVCMILVAIVGVFLFIRRRNKKKLKYLEDVDESNITAIESLQFAFGTIKDATNNFSDNNKLGRGGFGTVYKGKLPNGQEIAVKRLSKDSSQGVVEFMNEVVLLAKLQHRNLVKLLGFALEGEEKVLVYEFLPNASLDIFLFEPTKRSSLEWHIRYNIIGGIAKGMLYLHEDSRLKIIHRDLKATNVLLDGEMNPKIADFGMARLFKQDETHESTTKVAGTYGYMPPEYVIDGRFSIKSDVFSFGVLVLEIVSGLRNNDFQNDEGMLDLLSFAWKNWKNNTFINVVDPFLRSSSPNAMSDIRRCIHIGLLCVQKDPADRPAMTSVVLMLSSLSMTMTLPTEPAFYIHSDRESHFLTHGYTLEEPDENNVSITELYPR